MSDEPGVPSEISTPLNWQLRDNIPSNQRSRKGRKNKSGGLSRDQSHRRGRWFDKVDAQVHLLAMSRSFRFPKERATKKQESDFRSLIRNMVLAQTLKSYDYLPNDFLADLFGMKPPTLRRFMQENVDPHRGHESIMNDFMEEFFTGILQGKYAGPLGHRRTQLTTTAFGWIDARTNWLYSPDRPDDDLARIDDDYSRMFMSAFKLDYIEWCRRAHT